MLKKTLSAFCIILQLLTQSAFALEFQPIIVPSSAVSNPLDNNTNDLVTAMTYESSFNQIDTLTDPKGNITTYTYDFELPTNDPKYATRGDLIKITYPTVAAGTPFSEFTYNSHGQVTEAKDPNGIVTQYTYDGTTGYLEVVTQDPGGIHAVTSLSYDANGYPDTVTDANGKVTDYDYDALGWLNKVTDPKGFETKYTYDANGNVTKIEKQASTGLTPAWQTTDFTYTRLNHVATVTDPLSRVTTYYAWSSYGLNVRLKESILVDRRENKIFQNLGGISREGFIIIVRWWRVRSRPKKWRESDTVPEKAAIIFRRGFRIRWPLCSPENGNAAGPDRRNYVISF